MALSILIFHSTTNNQVLMVFFPSARYQRRRGVGHSDQGNHRWRWSHPPHPQVSHRQEGRGWCCSSVIEDPRNVNISTVPMYLI